MYIHTYVHGVPVRQDAPDMSMRLPVRQDAPDESMRLVALLPGLKLVLARRRGESRLAWPRLLSRQHRIIFLSSARSLSASFSVLLKMSPVALWMDSTCLYE